LIDTDDIQVIREFGTTSVKGLLLVPCITPAVLK